MTGRVRAGRRTRSRCALASVGASLALVVSGCGNRNSEDELLAALQVPAGSSVGAPVAGRPVTGATGAGTQSASPSGSSAASGAAPESPAADVPVPGGPATATEGGGEPAVGAATPTCTGAEQPIVIASVGQQTGLVGSLLASGTTAVQAWVARANANGGLNCHQIEYLIADDGGDPSRHQALVRQMVEQEGAVAFVYMNATLSGNSAVEYLTERRIPVIGGSSGEDWFYESPVFFPQGTSGTQLAISAFALAGEVGAQLGYTRLASLACLEAPSCALPQRIAAEQSARFGLELVYRAEASLAQPDYTSLCQNAQRAGAQLLYSFFDGGSTRRIARSCNSIGYRPVFFTSSNAATLDLATDPLVDGLYANQGVHPWMNTTNPEVAAFNEAMETYAPGVEPDGSAILGWTAAKLFERAMQGVTGDAITSEQILDGLWTIQDDDLGGLTYPLTFTREQPAPQVVCFFQIQVSGGTYVTPNGGQRSCV